MASAPPALFFASSDEEGENTPLVSVDHESDLVPASSSQTPSEHTATSSLFLVASDQEEADRVPTSSPPQLAHSYAENVNDIEAQSTPHVKIVGSSAAAVSDATRNENLEEPPAKRRKHSPIVHSHAQLGASYIGDLPVDGAWSTVSGTGHVKVGDSVLIRREGSKKESSGPNTKKGNKTKKSSGGKQVSLTSMLSAKGTRFPKKVDTVVRIVNNKGSDLARLPTEIASWISKLLDFGLVEIRGTMTDCPEKLKTGMSLMVTLHIYLHPDAFKPLRMSSRDVDGGFTYNEGYETQEENFLRERKAAILKLFDAVGLRAQAGARCKGKKYSQKVEDTIGNLAQRTGGKTKKELVGDGEEIEVDSTEELSNNDLSLIYRKAQQKDTLMPLMDPAESFDLTLRGYQKQALNWMYSIEHDTRDAHLGVSMHPLWSQYIFPPEQDINTGDIDLTAEDKFFYFNPYSGELSLDVPLVEHECRGGILADVGMGKTIMISALIQTSLLLKDEFKEDKQPLVGPRQLRIEKAFRSSRRPNRRLPPSGTLIVAPASLLAQWAEEIQRSSKSNTLEVIIWHGHNRLDLDVLVNSAGDQDRMPKVVITSYGTLASEHAKTMSPLFDIYWLRIVLDEAHACKSRMSTTAKAVYDLRAKWRWAVTGTPIVNKLEDLFSLLKFLKHEPWSEYAYFRSFITLPFLARDPKAIEVVQVILENALLRREKNMLDIDGKKIVELPPKEITIEALEFSSLEKKIYDSIWLKVKRNFDQLEAKGLVGKNYTHILAMLMKLRRAVLHPDLVLEKEDSNGSSNAQPLDNPAINLEDLVKNLTSNSNGGSNVAFAEGVLANLADEDITECPICFDVMEVPTMILGCAHQCCKDCILTHIATCEEKGQQPNCFACGRGPINPSDLVEVIRKEPTNSQPSASVALRRNDVRSSTKLEALLKHLRRLKEEDPKFRAVVFSQFTSFLDLIQVMLQREGYDFCRFDGTMDVKKRSAALSAFKSPSKQPRILIISLKAGGVGLNLTTANHVFMMDCWWNAATENQAIDRVHRIGQDKTVHVTHFIISNTIEGRILQIQKRKTAIVREAFRGTRADGRADPDSIENLKIMFEEEGLRH
ncbi:hypothetical protein AGABI1DRAFT_67033 [Agaricus bisporus var. burnettii JB137-S8]|uniref:DNA repair protein RAD5 n=1 Tax=Agaricus bisporus var. burnettii (strain JB137-S8 / ATCC MYA-4627 / FGSC 10392) TaxID=597362 RepID=K5WAM9_AGABU|nr:uncharacterized protein AGABI1DRAFT_67033 [Agaricus bisporus var. burnettii JB137-S8]EKM83939.1 hypothetical protein AGABI1DRAFT_67033 [Agaricus bisporus var. burnettii JB137-S8]